MTTRTGLDGWAAEEQPRVRGGGHSTPEEAGVPLVPGYELGELLARGATSEVWAAADLSVGRGVVVKVVHAALGAVEAAAREAAVSAHVASAHVVAVEACVPLADGRVALVMPHVRGGSLDGLVRARGHLAPGEVVTVLAPVASAIGRLHELGVVHGDVSPGNVLLHLDGRPVLGDLGLSHVVGEASPGVWGTDGYVAPEVVLGADPTPAADVYGLGALGWLCLTGRVPGPPGLRPALADLSRAGAAAASLVDVLEAAAAPEPQDRPTAHELAWQLFEAAEPVALDLVKHDDEVSAVTYRLRAGASDRPDSDPRQGGKLLRRLLPGERRQRRWRHAGGPAALRVLRRRTGRTVLVTAASAAAVVLLLVIGATVASPGGPNGAAEAGGRDRPGLTGPAGQPRTPTTTTPTAPTAPTDLRMDLGAATRHPAALLGQLSDHRASAWREGAPALLSGADAPDSVAANRDAAAVSEMVRAGVRYTGLRHTVSEAQLVTASARGAVLTARIDTGAYAVTGPSGVDTTRPAQQGEKVLVDLVWTDVGWRISDVRPTP